MSTNSETPRTDAAEGEAYIGVASFDGADICKAYDFARTLERELNEARKSFDYEHALVHSLQQQLTTLRADRDQWKKLAGEFHSMAEHLHHCEHSSFYARPCTCGLTQLREEFERMGKV